jgi:hypothetical protein
MNMPGFTADKSVFPSGGYYRGAGMSRQIDGGIQPAGTYCFTSWIFSPYFPFVSAVQHCFDVPIRIQGPVYRR